VKFPAKGGEWSLTDEHLARLESAYPGIELDQHLREAREWLHANPRRRKTQRGMPTFLTNWLNKVRAPSSTSPPNVVPPSQPSSGGWRIANAPSCPVCGKSDLTGREDDGTLTCFREWDHPDRAPHWFTPEAGPREDPSPQRSLAQAG